MADEIKEWNEKLLVSNGAKIPYTHIIDIKTLEDYNWTLLNVNSIRYLLFYLLPSFQEVSIISTSLVRIII